MTITETPLLLLLVLAHLMGDFVLQKSDWIDERYAKHWKSKRLYIHFIIHSFLSLAVLGFIMPSSWQLLGFALIIGTTHFLIDLIKSYLNRTDIIWFVIDQLAHLLVIFYVWIAVTDQWVLLGHMAELALNEKILLAIVAYFIVIWPFSMIIGLICKRWAAEITGMGSLPNAGRMIGQIERFLILTFIIAGQFTAIGFLLAAKSILRFGDSKENNHRKINEYILIGTMASFSITISFGLFIKMLIDRL